MRAEAWLRRCLLASFECVSWKAGGSGGVRCRRAAAVPPAVNLSPGCAMRWPEESRGVPGLLLVGRVVLQPGRVDFFRLAFGFLGHEPLSAIVLRGGALLGHLLGMAVHAVRRREAGRLGLLLNVHSRRRRSGEEHPA